MSPTDRWEEYQGQTAKVLRCEQASPVQRRANRILMYILYLASDFPYLPGFPFTSSIISSQSPWLIFSFLLNVRVPQGSELGFLYLHTRHWWSQPVSRIHPDSSLWTSNASLPAHSTAQCGGLRTSQTSHPFQVNSSHGLVHLSK